MLDLLPLQLPSEIYKLSVELDIEDLTVLSPRKCQCYIFFPQYSMGSKFSVKENVCKITLK